MRKLILVFAGILFFTSCITVKKVKYVRDVNQDTKQEILVQQSTPYKVQSKDYLYIKILSLDEKTFSFFNADAGDNATLNDIKLYITSYQVNDSGYIDLPIAGKIQVLGLTIEEARVKVQSVVNEYLQQSTVIMKLVSFQITVLGEVNRPGKFMIFNEQVNLFEALGLAGDVTDYGNKKKVTLMRQTQEGTLVATLDLSSKQILTSEYFYLKPGDIIYLEPLRAKSYGARSFTFGTMLATVSTLVTLLIYINK